jgi:choline dehydrogenase-like flavoprotein
MTDQPKDFQSDTAGRPHGFSRVHVVDASVFPSIPAPNLTFTVMANARRIVAMACEA